MFAPTNYLRWAHEHFPHASFDLGSSGVAGAARPGVPLPVDIESASAWEGLRERIAIYNGVPSEEVLPALGTSHALWTAYASLLAPGDEVLVESVRYEPLHRIAEGVGARTAFFERRIEDGFALDPACVERAMTDRTRAIVLTNLHNPTGVRADDVAIRSIAAIAEKRGAYVLVDEVYAPFDTLTDGRGVWGRSARRLAPNIVAVGSLTKCYGLGPHRVGWMLGPSEVIARGNDARIASVGELPRSWAAMAASAFDTLPSFAEWSRANVMGKQARVEAWLRARPHLAWSAPADGLFGLAIDRRTTADLTARIEAGVRDHGVVVAPGAFFGVPNGFRLAWSLPEAKLDEALARLARALD